LLTELLGWAGERRRRRRRRRTVAVGTALAGLALAAIGEFSPRSGTTPRVREKWTCPMVRTARFQPDLAGLSFDPVARVQTPKTGAGYRVIDDNELLALAAGRGGVLVRTGPRTERLIFPQ